MRNQYTKSLNIVLLPLILLAFAGANASNTPIGTSCQTVNVDPSFHPTAYNVTGINGYYCEGDGGLPVGVANSETGVTYILYMDDVATGKTLPGNNGSPIEFGNQVVPDKNIYHFFTVKGTNAGDTTEMMGSDSISELEKFTPTITIWSDVTIVLPGTNVIFYSNPDYGEDPTFQWYKNGSPVGGDDYTYEEFAPQKNDQFYVKMTDKWPCVTTPSQTVTSDTITLTVVDNFWTGTTNSYWNIASNWLPTLIPSSGADVYIPVVHTHSLYIPDSISCHNLIVKSGGNLTISNTGALTLSGTLTLNGSNGLFIESNEEGTGSFIDNGIAGTGTANVRRYLTTDSWHYISSPINNATASIFNNDYLRTSDPSSTTGWGDYITESSTPLAVMRGYTCWKPTGNLTSEAFTGKLNTGTKTFTGNRTATDPYAGWHLVGNPYPSSIDLASGSITWDQFEHAAYFWDESGLGNTLYASGNYNVALASPANFGTHTKYAPPGQGFFVHIIDTYDGNSTLAFTNAARVHNAEAFLKDAPVIQNALLIVATGYANTYSDKATVHFNPDATSGYDPGYDAYKLRGLNEAPQLYTRIGNTNVTCNALPFVQKNMVVPMGFTCGLPGTYTLTADSLTTFERTISITLEDLKLNTTQDLRINAVYTFHHDTIDNPNRFILHFDNPTFGVNDHGQQCDLQIYSYENFIYVRKTGTDPLSGKMTVYDFMGRERYTWNLPDSPVSKYELNLNTGNYIVKIITPDNVYLQKVLIRR